MPSTPEFLAYVVEQLALGSRLTSKRMFGEFGLYVDGRLVALVCDDSLHLKSLPGSEGLLAGLPLAPPYPGAKPYPVADEWLDDGERLQAVFLGLARLAPEPKAKRLRAAGGTGPRPPRKR